MGSGWGSSPDPRALLWEGVNPSLLPPQADSGLGSTALNLRLMFPAAKDDDDGLGTLPPRPHSLCQQPFQPSDKLIWRHSPCNTAHPGFSSWESGSIARPQRTPLLHTELLILSNAHFHILLYTHFFHLKCPRQAGPSLWSPDPSLRQPATPSVCSSRVFQTSEYSHTPFTVSTIPAEQLHDFAYGLYYYSPKVFL